jgi:formamidopyrimidine-DNA glycosylase
VPELPEVETTRRQLEPVLTGRTISAAEVLDSLWCSPVAPREIERELAQARIEHVARRGKYLFLELVGGAALAMHLRMTGNLLWVEPGGDFEERFLRVRFELDDGGRLLFVDARRFGTGHFYSTRQDLHDFLDARLGPEPLDERFTADVLARAAAGRRAPVKAFLLDQRRVAGIGNIYADEALFRARIHPLQPAGRLRRPEIARLRDAIVESLEAGIAAQGASIDDYRHYNGERGGMQDEFLVHRREGSPCPRCGRSVVKLRAAGRGTYVCRSCQRAPRRQKVLA